MPSRIKVKICCIQDTWEARLAIESGADAIGLVAEMPSGPGPIPDDKIVEIARTVPPEIDSFLLTSRTAPGDVVEHVKKCGTNVVQLVDAVPVVTYEALRDNIPSLKIVQVIHVEGEESLLQVASISSFVDYVLLDSGTPNAETKILGGTGKTHNWDISARIVSETGTPVFLAGGLNPDNVGEAIRRVRPYGVDLCSGVRTNGKLDPEKLKAFMNNIDNEG